MQILEVEKFKALCRRVISLLATHGIGRDEVSFEVVYKEFWTISLFVSCKAGRVRELQKKVEAILVDEIGVDRERVSFLGKNTSKESYEWYFSHPDTPFEVLAFADRIADEVKEEVDLSIPIPNSSKVVETAHLVLKGEYYRQIEAGSKTKECRELNQYYCNKFFGGGKRVGKVRFQLGYSTREGSKPPQMEFQVKDILLVNGIDGSEFPAMVEGRMTTYRDLPRGFVPAAYLLLLGKRIV